MISTSSSRANLPNGSGLSINTRVAMGRQECDRVESFIMIVKAISIRRVGTHYYSDPKGNEPFAATLEMIGEYGKVELRLSPDMSQRIVEIVADEIAKAGRATAEALTAEVISGQPLIAAE